MEAYEVRFNRQIRDASQIERSNYATDLLSYGLGIRTHQEVEVRLFLYEKIEWAASTQVVEGIMK